MEKLLGIGNKHTKIEVFEDNAIKEVGFVERLYVDGKEVIATSMRELGLGELLGPKVPLNFSHGIASGEVAFNGEDLIAYVQTLKERKHIIGPVDRVIVWNVNKGEVVASERLGFVSAVTFSRSNTIYTLYLNKIEFTVSARRLTSLELAEYEISDGKLVELNKTSFDVDVKLNNLKVVGSGQNYLLLKDDKLFILDLINKEVRALPYPLEPLINVRAPDVFILKQGNLLVLYDPRTNTLIPLAFGYEALSDVVIWSGKRSKLFLYQKDKNEYKVMNIIVPNELTPIESSIYFEMVIPQEVESSKVSGEIPISEIIEIVKGSDEFLRYVYSLKDVGAALNNFELAKTRFKRYMVKLYEVEVGELEDIKNFIVSPWGMSFYDLSTGTWKMSGKDVEVEAELVVPCSRRDSYFVVHEHGVVTQLVGDEVIQEVLLEDNPIAWNLVNDRLLLLTGNLSELSVVEIGCDGARRSYHFNPGEGSGALELTYPNIHVLEDNISYLNITYDHYLMMKGVCKIYRLGWKCKKVVGIYHDPLNATSDGYQAHLHTITDKTFRVLLLGKDVIDVYAPELLKDFTSVSLLNAKELALQLNDSITIYNIEKKEFYELGRKLGSLIKPMFVHTNLLLIHNKERVGEVEVWQVLNQ